MGSTNRRNRSTHSRRQSGIAWILALLFAGVFASHSSAEEIGNVATLPAMSEHSVWVPDRLLRHSLLFDGDSGEVLATVDSGVSLTPKAPLYSRPRNEIYSVDIDYSRGTRGTRIDYVTIYDARTLDVTGEVVLPQKTAESNASLAHVALLDDERWLAVFSQFPNQTVTIVDLNERRVAGEVTITGCAGIYATGERSFATLCGDGTVLVTHLDASGGLERRVSSEEFFSVVDDPVFMAAARAGRDWVFVTFEGMIHRVRFRAEAPAPQEPWSLVGESEVGDDWRPGGLQHVAVHDRANRLFVVMHQGGSGTHKDAGPEVWAYDLGTRERTARFGVPNLAASFLTGLLELESGGWGAWLLEAVVPNPGVHTITVTQDEQPLLFARNAELGAIAVLDLETGEHLRTLEEAGLFGPTLAVP